MVVVVFAFFVGVVKHQTRQSYRLLLGGSKGVGIRG